MAAIRAQAYPDHRDEPGVAEHERAIEHREQALSMLIDGNDLGALAHALLAIEARVEELTCYIARGG
ncbi:MAG: hypothetical protein WAL38_18920 [Solirubrobacteraceae bacterium]